MRQLLSLALLATTLSIPVGAQTLDKELIATIAVPAAERTIVSELLWDGGVLIIQSATLQPDNQLVPKYFAAPGPKMPLRQLETAPEGVDHYWKLKSSRISPTGLGKILTRADAQTQMFGVGSTQDRLLNAVGFGSMDTTNELRLGGRVIHSRKTGEAPYDGEVWGWSLPELNRIAYVDGKGDLWIARADGHGAERLARGPVTLPAWSEDGRLIAVTERKESGTRWDVSIVRVPERFRK